MTVETDAVIKHLEEKERKEGTLPQLLKFYKDLLRVQYRVEQKLASLPGIYLGSEVVFQRIQNGLTLIDFDDLAPDWKLIQDTFAEAALIFSGYPDLFGELPQSLKQFGAGDWLAPELVKAWFEGTELPELDGINEGLLQSLIQATIRPFLRRHSKALAPLIKPEQWRRSYCPVCGGAPDLAYLEKEQGARWLLCSRCDTEWLFQRLQCPFCDTQDQNALSYFTNDESLYRLYVCERCKRYLKAIDLRQAKAEVLLPLERLYTLNLDRQAQEKGYLPGGKSPNKNS